MNFFKRKKAVDIKPKECEHKYMDFPWYMEGTYYSNQNNFELKIYAPYVCVHCKQRKNIVLKERFRTDITWDEAVELEECIREDYEDKIMDSARVEEMIADMQLVDREYLKYLDMVRGTTYSKAAEVWKQVEDGYECSSALD